MRTKEYIHREDLMTISSVTGELTPIVLKDGDVVTHSAENEDIYVNRGRGFVKVFANVAAELCRRLSPAGLSVCFFLLRYIEPNSGILKKKNGAVLDVKYLCEQMERSDKTVRRGVQELIDEGVLAKAFVNNRQAFIANPFVFQNGSKINATLYQLFAKSGWRFV